jgi:hypothetical protein
MVCISFSSCDHEYDYSHVNGHGQSIAALQKPHQQLKPHRMPFQKLRQFVIQPALIAHNRPAFALKRL